MSITTPVNAQKAGDLTATQIETLRTGLAISDMPILADRTYIVFDATVGDNDLHLDTGATATDYSITKGDGTFATNYNDTGGTKVLNYTAAGRYMITIDGDFAGINVTVNSATTIEKNKYIKIIGGSNYSTVLSSGAYNGCLNLEYVNFDYVTQLNSLSLANCSSLLFAILPKAINIDANSFTDTENVIFISSDSISTTSKKIGLGVAEPTEDLDVLGNINVSGFVNAGEVKEDEVLLENKYEQITEPTDITASCYAITPFTTEKFKVLQRLNKLEISMQLSSTNTTGALIAPEIITDINVDSDLMGTRGTCWVDDQMEEFRISYTSPLTIYMPITRSVSSTGYKLNINAVLLY